MAGLASALLIPASSFAQTQEKGVVLIDRQGNRTEMAYTALDRIGLGEKGVTLVSRSGESAETYYANVDRILIGAAVSGLESAVAEAAVAVWPTVTEGPLNVKSDLKAEVTVTAMNGATVVRATAQPATPMSLDLAHLAPGVYIVNVGDCQVKIIKK